MLSFDELGLLLENITNELPQVFFKDLNGGINLLPEAKIHPESKQYNELFILGEYHNDYNGLGRYIIIYYGSFFKLYSQLQIEKQKEELKRILLHEFTHHLESLAGERGLEIKDKIDITKYKYGYL